MDAKTVHVISRRLRGFMSFMELRDLIYVALLTFFFLFVSSVVTMQGATIEVYNEYGFPMKTIMTSWGFPLKMAEAIPWEEVTPQFDDPSHYSLFPMYQGGGMTIFWYGLILDIMFYLLMAFGLTYFIMWLRYRRRLK